MTDTDRMTQLLTARHSCVTMLTYEESEAIGVVRAAAGKAGLELLEWSVSTGLRDGLAAAAPVVPNTEHPAAALAYLCERDQRMTVAFCDLAAHLKDERVMRLLRELIARCAKSGGCVVLIDQATEMPAAIRAMAVDFDLSLPGTPELEQLVRDTLRTIDLGGRITIQLTRPDLDTMVRNLRGLNIRQARQVVLDAICPDHRLDAADINTMLAQKRRMLQGERLLEYIEAPVSLDEIGGLRRLKFWLEQRRESLSPEAVKFGLEPPRGVLMLGVQGAGKSLAAKAVATAWQRPLLRMDVGELYDKYIGETERRLRESLRQAEQMAPIVLWIDEIEKAFASAASQSSDGGLSKRMFGTLLTWMQERTAPVFLIATANDIEALPPELLRKGRFDEIFFVDLPDADARRAIFQIHLRKRKQDPQQFDLDRLTAAAEGYSGAEIEQGIIAAMHNAFAQRAELSTDLVNEALQHSPPLSVTMAEKVDALRHWSEGRCVPAD